MNCPETTLLAQFVDGRLSPAEVAYVEEHLQGCQPCFDTVNMLAACATETSRATSGALARSATLDELFGAIEALGYQGRSASQRSAHVRPPAQIGRYEIRGILGRGAMGVVYRAHDPQTGRGLAIKTASSVKASAMSSLRQEIAFLRTSRHHGVVQILDYDLTGRNPWYAMELLEGETLADRNLAIWRDAPIDPCPDQDGHNRPDAAGGHLPEVLQFFWRLCEPLSFVHRAGMVHCDLKPANVFIRGGEQPVLMDFGLVHDARGMVGREALAVGRRRGTAHYMSPEVIAERLPEHRADLYSLGCMLYESLTGRPPFLAGTQQELLQAHTHREPALPSTLVNNIPPALDALIASLLAKRPQDRVGRVDDVADALGRLIRTPSPRAGSDKSARAAYLFRPRLVGRESYVNDILARCEEALAGRGSMILLSGESGIGKTFLATDVSQRALLKGMRVLTGECIPVGAEHRESSEPSGAPLHPFRKVLEAVGDRWLELAPNAAQSTMGSKLRLLAAYEPRLLHLTAEEDREPAVALPGPAARERLMEALAEILAQMAAERPLLLTLDDLQWADDLSVAFLDWLQSGFLARVPLVILGTCRTDEAGEVVRRISAKPWVTNWTLGRVDATEVRTIASEMLAMAEPPRVLVEFLNAHSEGVPFFVAEYLRAVTAEGLLAREEGQWRLCDGDPGRFSALSFPTHLAGLVGRRVNALPPHARRAADGAAVLGREFERRVLAGLLGRGEASLDDSLEQMILRQIAEQVRPDTYRFLHDAIRERIYAELDAGARTDLHGRAADAMRRCGEGTNRNDAHYGEIAHHLLSAGRLEEAVEYLEKAGERALRVSADSDAARHFREALDTERRLPTRLPAVRRARWERQTADAEQGLGRMQESVAPLTRAAALLGWPLPASPRRMTLMLVPSALEQLLHRLVPDHFLGSGVDDSERLMEAGRVFDRLQRVYYYLGEEMPLLLANLRTLNLSELARPSAELAMAYANAAAVAGILPAHGLAERYFELALSTSAVTPDPAVASYIEMLQAVHWGGIGRVEKSARHAETAIALAESVGFCRRKEESLAVRGQLELSAGRLDRASPWLDMLTASSKRRGDAHMQCWAALLSAQHSILAGDIGQATASIEEAAQCLDKVGRPEKIWKAGLETYTAFRNRDFVAAVEAADRAAELIAMGPPAHVYCFDAYARVAEVRVALWEARCPVRPANELARAARAACRVVLRAARIFPLAVPAAMLHEGSRRWIAGERRRARQLWVRGRAAAESMSLPYYEARLDLALATASPREGERSALLKTARKILADWNIVDGRDAQLAD